MFRRVSLPLAWRAIWAGVLLTWLRAFGEFGATVMLAYHPYSLPVYTYVAFERAGPAGHAADPAAHAGGGDPGHGREPLGARRGRTLAPTT